MIQRIFSPNVVLPLANDISVPNFEGDDHLVVFNCVKPSF